MGFDYTLFHLKYTIPPALFLSVIYRPLLQRIDVFKIFFLATLAVLSTIPWDSYLIQNKIWTYPPHVILGPKFLSIPIEEIFFFFIQTYNTTLIYLLMSKPLLHSAFLTKSSLKLKTFGHLIQFSIGLLFINTLVTLRKSNRSTYLALILIWALPFVFLLWSLASSFILTLPYTSTFLPIAVPTLYLWIVDTLALQRGTWKIENGTKLGLQLWDGLEIEEAIFFLTTNILVVLGLVALEKAIAILQTFPEHFPEISEIPSPFFLMKALLIQISDADEERVTGIQNAVQRLKQKSRSFYLASATFSGRLRIDLILLYSFCRVADDLVDNANTEDEAHKWISKLTGFIDLAYSKNKQETSLVHDIESYIVENFPISTHSALRLLPTHLISSRPLYDLFKGFKTDLLFLRIRNTINLNEPKIPIYDEHDLEIYAARVAGTVAELCLDLVFYHSKVNTTLSQRDSIHSAGKLMGIALQYVNIARDIEADSEISRVYCPEIWLKEVGITYNQILDQPFGPVVEKMRSRLLDLAFRHYQKSRREIEQIPSEARSPMKVAVESYMEIGRVIMEKKYRVKGRATVPKWRRLKVAWKALQET